MGRSASYLRLLLDIDEGREFLVTYNRERPIDEAYEDSVLGLFGELQPAPNVLVGRLKSPPRLSTS